jgi:hypothetical protein
MAYEPGAFASFASIRTTSNERAMRMSYDNVTTTWHLTPSGWIIADRAPEGAVMTCTAQLYQSSMWAKTEQRWRVVWTSPNREAVAESKARHGDRPDGHDDYND